MHGLVLDHFQWLLVIFNCDISAIDMSGIFLCCNKLLFHVILSGLDISQGFEGKDYWPS